MCADEIDDVFRLPSIVKTAQLTECRTVLHFRILHPCQQLSLEVVRRPLGEPVVLLDKSFESLSEFRVVRFRNWIAESEQIEAEEAFGVFWLHRAFK